MARQQLTYLLPPEAPAPRTPPAPKLRITPKTLNRVAPEPPPPANADSRARGPYAKAARGIAGRAAARRFPSRHHRRSRRSRRLPNSSR